MRDLCTQTVSHSDDIDAKHKVPIVVRNVFDGGDIGLFADYAGEIASAVDAGVEMGDGEGDPGLYGVSVAHVDDLGMDLGSGGFQLRCYI